MSVSEGTALTQISIAQKALAEAKDLTQILDIRDKAVAIHAWATARGADQAAQIAMELKLRAERKAGYFLLEMKENGELKPGRRWPNSNGSTLEQLEIDKKESHRWQKIASIPEGKFEDYIIRAKKMTQAALLNVAKEIEAEMAMENPEPIPIPEDLKIDIRNQDFREVEILNGSIDLILTDPPYNKESVHLFEDLALMAGRALRPGGYCVCYVGNLYLPNILYVMCKYLRYRWTIAISLPGSHVRIAGFFQDWRPVLVFQKEPVNFQDPWMGDLLINQERNKQLHEWQQGLEPFLELVDAFSKAGNMVFDPMVGAGTTIEACIQKKRNCIACEIDNDTFTLLRKRFCVG